MKQNINPEKILKNLRTIIEEAERACAREGDGGLDEDRLAELREQVQIGFARLREYYDTLGDRVSACYSEAENRLRDYYSDVEDRLRHKVESTDLSLRTHPYQMAAATFGVGLVVGAWLRSSRLR